MPLPGIYREAGNFFGVPHANNAIELQCSWELKTVTDGRGHGFISADERQRAHGAEESTVCLSSHSARSAMRIVRMLRMEINRGPARGSLCPKRERLAPDSYCLFPA